VKRRKTKEFVRFGDKFGRWTVIGTKAQYPRGSTGSAWLCRCECGSTAVIATGNLRKGKSTQCAACGHKSAGKKCAATLERKAKAQGRTARLGHTWVKPCKCGAVKGPQYKSCMKCRVGNRIYTETYQQVADRYGITKQAVQLAVARHGWDGMLATYAKKYGGAK